MIYATMCVVLAAMIVSIDRITKWWAILHCSSRIVEHDLSLVSCHVLYNRGVSWSLFHSLDTVPFVVVGILTTSVTLMLLWFVISHRNSPECSLVGGVLAIAGSCSNIIDRIIYGGVVDFILISYNGYSFPVFNIADVCIVIGIMLILIKSYRAS